MLLYFCLDYVALSPNSQNKREIQTTLIVKTLLVCCISFYFVQTGSRATICKNTASKEFLIVLCCLAENSVTPLFFAKVFNEIKYLVLRSRPIGSSRFYSVFSFVECRLVQCVGKFVYKNKGI